MYNLSLTFDRDWRNWTVVSHTTSSITFSLVDPDGMEGFPGEVISYVTYTLTPYQWHIQMNAIATTKKTPIMLSSHVCYHSETLRLHFCTANILRPIGTWTVSKTQPPTRLSTTPSTYHTLVRSLTLTTSRFRPVTSTALHQVVFTTGTLHQSSSVPISAHQLSTVLAASTALVTTTHTLSTELLEVHTTGERRVQSLSLPVRTLEFSSTFTVTRTHSNFTLATA